MASNLELQSQLENQGRLNALKEKPSPKQTIGLAWTSPSSLGQATQPFKRPC
jgi:hypothetical protein